MKQKKSIKKYNYDGNINETLPSHAHMTDIREQLRQALEQLEQAKLSIQLQAQKRILAEHQLQQTKEQSNQIKTEMEFIKKQLGKLSKKYSKIKENKKQSCQKCKQQVQSTENIQRERQVFLKERSVLKNQIKELKRTIENFESKDSATLTLAGNNRLLDQLRRESQEKNRVIDEQKKVIRYLDEKLSSFELEKLQTLNYVESIDQKLQELQMENTILKGFPTTGAAGISHHRRQVRADPGRLPSFLESPSRRNGSIKNLEKLNKSKSRDSPPQY